MKPGSFFAPALIFLFIFSATHVFAQNELIFRKYAKIGVLLTPPNTADLDYASDGHLDDRQEVSVVNYGVGFQVLKEREGSFSIGGEIGFHNLFSSVVHFDWPSGGYDDSFDREWGLYLGPLVEVPSANSNVFFQGGIGLNIIYYHFLSESDDYRSGGVDASPGIHGSVGTSIKINERVSLPFALRADIIFRYGVLIQTGIVFGINSYR